MIRYQEDPLKGQTKRPPEADDRYPTVAKKPAEMLIHGVRLGTCRRHEQVSTTATSPDRARRGVLTMLAGRPRQAGARFPH